MARIIILILAGLLHANHAFAENLAPDVLPAAAVTSYREYWQAFETYERNTFKAEDEKYQKSWQELRDGYSKELEKSKENQLASLKKAEDEYRYHITNYPNSSNMPYVLLNLAQVLTKQAALNRNEAQFDANRLQNEALSLTSDIESMYPEFEKIDQALYLKAILLAGLGRDQTADQIWMKIVKKNKRSVYSAQAAVALGDRAFKNDQADTAKKYYQKALTLLPDDPKMDLAMERIRIEYRLIWAAYRSADLKTAIEAGLSLLAPRLVAGSHNQQQRIRQDAVELIGDSLFENDNMFYSKAVLKQQPLLGHGAAIGLRIIENLQANKSHEKITQIGEYVYAEFPTAKEIPDVLSALASSYKALGEKPKMVFALERLALLLPGQSLWRSRQRDDTQQAIRHMEEEAAKASRYVANYYYEQGMNSGNRAMFETASSFYKNVLDHNPNTDQAEELRLRIAHAYFFADKLAGADKGYEDLKRNHLVSDKVLQVASYQLVLTREKLWREAFAKAVDRGKNPGEDPVLVAHLRRLEEAIEEYAGRFPNIEGKGSYRTVDLFLVGAAANRDVEKYDQASKYWQRALVSSPTAGQRAIAIRGLMMAAVRSGKSNEVVELARKFLRLEDWDSLGLTLGNELKGILASAARSESEKLSDAGDVALAGGVLTGIATEFKDIPERDKLYRDGSYMLAIGGEWERARQAAEDFLAQGKGPFSGDMMYLKARVLENQMRFGAAATAYLQLAERHPKHQKAGIALERAERFANGEGNKKLAGQAAELAGDRESKRAERLAAYDRSIAYYRPSDAGKAEAVAKKRLQVSRNDDEKLMSQLLIAEAAFDGGKEKQALKSLNGLARQADRKQDDINEETYNHVYAISNFHLGEELREKFNDFELAERRGGVEANLKAKLKMFEQMAAKYNNVVKTGNEEWAPQSRYLIGESAEALAAEINKALRHSPPKTDAARNNLEQTAVRLTSLAKKSYSSNLLDSSKNPKKYQNNIWIKKSNLKLAGLDSQYKIIPSAELELPPALNSDTSPQWSLE